MRFVRRFLKAVIVLDLVAAVAALITKSLVKSEGGPSDSRFRLVAIFDGAQFRSSADAFETGTVVAMFGGAQVDLRRAGPGSVEAVLDVTAAFGGVEIVVPDTWAVTQRGPTIAGGVDVRVPEATTLPADATRLTIHTRVVFGGVSVVGRPVLKPAEG